MGTLKTAIDNARLKTRDTYKLVFPEDDDLIAIVNGILANINQHLHSMESRLAYGFGQVTTAADVDEYVLAFDHDGMLDDGVWIDGEATFLRPTTEDRKISWDLSTTGPPTHYYLTAAGAMGFLDIPDAAYVVNCYYWLPLTRLDSYADDDLPWGGVWNQAVEEMLAVEMLEIMERDSSARAAIAAGAWNKSEQRTYAHGVRARRVRGDMFNVRGV